MSATTDLYPVIKDWVEARKKEGVAANDVLEALGLHLIPGSTAMNEEMRWALAATAAMQYRARVKPRERLADVRAIPLSRVA